ncbi:MAG TPA: tetratricopeptide repeat protein [Polyangia bacterium]
MQELAFHAPIDDRAHALALVEDLLTGLEHESDPARRAVALCRIAEIYERRLVDANSALITLQEAFREDPTSGQVVHEMERLARAFDKWPDVVWSTTEVAETLAEPRQAADLWAQIAFWCDVGLGSADDAVAAGQRALGLVPDHGGALMLLETLYRRRSDWDRLADVLDRKWLDRFREPTRIADAYSEILRDNPQHLPSLMGLARVQEALGDWEGVVRLLGRAAEQMNGQERVGLHFQLGEVALAQVGDPVAAEEQYAQALALDPAHVPSMLALVQIYRERNDWLKAATLLGRAADRVAAPDKKIELTFEAATIFQERLDDENQATALYAQIVALEPMHAAAALPLMEIYFKRQAWAALRPLAQSLADNGPGAAGQGRGAAWQATVCHRLGRAAEGLGDTAAAVEAYRRSFSADLGYLPTLRDWGALAFTLQDWEQAAQLYDSVLFPRRERPSREDTFEALYRLGQSRLHLHQEDKAVDLFTRALAIDPQHRPTLEALADIHTRAANWDALTVDLRGLLALPNESEARAALHERLVDIYHDRKNDPERAIAECFAALEASPEAPRILHKLVELLTETQQWARVLPILARLAETAQGATRARYLVAAGTIQNHELGDGQQAVDLYNQALDDDPHDLKTFERIDKILTAAKDWKQQARCYRRQIKRMGTPSPASRPALLALWHGLGEISRSRLHDFQAAAAAFEVCVGLEPEEPSRHAILAELHQLCGPEHYGQAIDEHRFLVRNAAGIAEMVPHLKRLLRLHAERTDMDAAWCVAQALSYLGQADADEQRLFAQYRPQGFVRARGRLTEELWQKHVYHRDEDRVVSQVLGTVAPTVLLARAKPHKDWGLKRKRQRDVANDPSLFCKVLTYASQILGVPWPEVHLVTSSSGEIELCNAIAEAAPTPSFVVGRGVLQGRHEAEIAFVAARALALSRADHLALWPSVVPVAAELEVILLAAITMVRDGHPIPTALANPVLRYRDFLGRTLSPAQLEQLELVVNRTGAGAGTTFDVERWARGAQLTAVRAGFLIGNDLRMAVQLATAANPGADATRIERDLIEWSVSKDYLALRAHIGFGPT